MRYILLVILCLASGCFADLEPLENMDEISIGGVVGAGAEMGAAFGGVDGQFGGETVNGLSSDLSIPNAILAPSAGAQFGTEQRSTGQSFELTPMMISTN